MTLAALPAIDIGWMDRAACRGLGPDLFYADDTSAAKAICASCPVQADCLDYALTAREPAGVWGGKGHGSRKSADKPPMPRYCKSCGALFTDTRAEYCSDTCRRDGYLRAHREHHLRTAV